MSAIKNLIVITSLNGSPQNAWKTFKRVCVVSGIQANSSWTLFSNVSKSWERASVRIGLFFTKGQGIWW